jgi:malate dehydrogenase (oxaloacetate-decarboxylating)(NADP+)
MIRKEDSLKYHSDTPAGKIAIKPTKPCLTPREMRFAYLPGASFPCQEIKNDPQKIFKYTSKGNLVGIITNGSAVPGLGHLGAAAAKPMQEGAAILFKRLADIDVFDLEMETSNPEKFIESVLMLEPTFGGINIKDIRAPEGLYIYDQLCEQMKIPVFHENLYSTAIVAMAALINAVDLAEKQIVDLMVVICGAGTVGTGCARLLLRLGVRPGNLLLYDIKGLLHPKRDDLHEYQKSFSNDSGLINLADGLKKADVFIGASAPGVFSQEMIRSMAKYPVVFALATPEPELAYDAIKSCRQDVIAATSIAGNPNAILDILSFPYVFRGALDVQATAITENMMLAAAKALAKLAREEVVEEVDRAYGNEHFSFGPEYLVPRAIDPRILVRESAAVAEQAKIDGVAAIKIEKEIYQEHLVVRLGTGGETLRSLVMRARNKPLNVVFPEGNNETILRASGVLMDEGIANPILLGAEDEIHLHINKLGLDLRGVKVIDPRRDLYFDDYVNQYFEMRKRRGVMKTTALQYIEQPDYFAAMMVHNGHADMMIAGYSVHYSESLRTILEVIGTAEGIKRISSHYLILLPKDVVFLADCAVNINPDAEELAEIAALTAIKCQTLGIEPQVAMLSFSNFGSVEHPHSFKVRKATEIIKQRYPDLKVDGEMQLAIARDSKLRNNYFPFASLVNDANVLIFPDLQSGNLTMHSLQYMAEAIPIGPVLMGTRLPAHLIQYGASVEEVVNLTTVGVVEAGSDL